MKKYFLIPVLLFFVMGFGAQSQGFAVPGSGTRGSVDAEEMIKDIIGVVGLKANFELKAANIPNAAAITYNGKRYIAYNPNFIANLNAKAGNKWASVSILAHEVGHHLNGHTLLPGGSQPALELEADEFSGFVLRKMGATLSQAQAAMNIAADYKAGVTHPGQPDRLAAIAKGWNEASAKVNDMAKYNKPSPLPTGRQQTPGGSMSRQHQTARVGGDSGEASVQGVRVDSRFILARVTFPAERTAAYFVTRQFNLVKLVNNELVNIGKMMPTNDPSYPFVMRNDRGTLFVDRSGRIFTPNNELAGYLTMG